MEIFKVRIRFSSLLMTLQKALSKSSFNFENQGDHEMLDVCSNFVYIEKLFSPFLQPIELITTKNPKLLHKYRYLVTS